MLNSVIRLSIKMNFTQIGQQVWNAQAEAHLRPEVKHGFHSPIFKKAHNNSTALRASLLRRILTF